MAIQPYEDHNYWEVVMRLFLNTEPQANKKSDGGVFYTVLVGVPMEILVEKTGLSVAEAKAMKVTYEVHPEKVSVWAKAFRKAQAKGRKLVLDADDIVITDPKLETFMTKTGQTVTRHKASTWTVGDGKLSLSGGTIKLSDELRDLLEEDEDDDTL